MTKRQMAISTTPTRVNTGNIISRLRRIRTELGQMLQQVDDALARLEQENRAA